MMNIRSYRKAIREIKKGEQFYFNAISASVAMVEYTKELVKNGTIKLDMEELEKMIVPEALDKFLTGEALAPQMFYIKQ